MSLLPIFAAGSTVQPAVDPYWSNVVLLLHMDGSNGGTTFTDSSSYGMTITPTGVTTNTGTVKYGTAAAAFASPVTSLLYVPSGGNFGTSDFTIEFWVYAASVTGSRQYIAGSGIAAHQWQIALEQTTQKIIFWTESNITLLTSTTSVALSTWTHVAIVRAGTTTTLYINGARDVSATDTGNYSSAAYGIGSWQPAAPGTTYGMLSGSRLDDFRITTLARYTGNFTPPAAAFPNQGNTGWATWNPSDKSSLAVLSNGNLTISHVAASAHDGARATKGKSSGKWYWEQTGENIGIGNLSAAVATGNYVGGDANGWGYNSSGNKYNAGISTAYGATFTAADTIGVALDLDNGNLSWFKNNVFQGIAFTGLSGTLYPFDSIYSAITSTTNFGATALTYTPPNGTFWNAADKNASTTLRNNNMTFVSAAATLLQRATTGKSTGKYYYEFTVPTGATAGYVSISNATDANSAVWGNSANNWGYAFSGLKYNSGSASYGNTWANNDVIGVAVDLTNGKIWFSKNGTWQASGDPVAGTNAAYTTLSGTLYPSTGARGDVCQVTLNTGATPFAYTPPTGYSAWDATVYNAGVF